MKSETEARAQLKRPRAAGPKDLIEATRRLAERRGTGQVAAVATITHRAILNQAKPTAALMTN